MQLKKSMLNLCCLRFSHPAIEAAIKIYNQYSLNLNEIKDINIQTYLWAVNKHDHTNINGVSSAKMSIPFSVAVALKTGKAGLNEFSEEFVKNDEILKLTKKIKVRANEKLTALFQLNCSELKCD